MKPNLHDTAAIQSLRQSGVDPASTDFHTLTGAQVDHVLTLADAAKYRKPRGANGSRARYYFARLARVAAGPKTQLLYVVQGHYGRGWEDLTASESRREARDDLKAYRDNEPGPHRLIVRREAIR